MTERVSLRRVMEAIALAGVVMTAVGVYLLSGCGWALIVGGVLTVAWALVIVDIPPRPVHTDPRSTRTGPLRSGKG